MAFSVYPPADCNLNTEHFIVGTPAFSRPLSFNVSFVIQIEEFILETCVREVIPSYTTGPMMAMIIIFL